MQLEAIHWKSSQPLTEDYNRQFSRVEPLFDFNPWEQGGWVQRAEWLDKSYALQADRSKLVEVLLEYNKAIVNTQEAIDRIEQLKDSKALAVVGGQQAGLFGGPLLAIYKAVTLLQTARQAAAELQRPIIPIFWIAGEDHDFDEVNHLLYLSNQLQVEKIKIEHPTGRRNSISRMQIDSEAWQEVLDQLDASLMDTEFKLPLIQKLREIMNSSDTLVTAFARIMVMLFGSYGLVLMDSDDSKLRRLEAPMFELLLKRNEEVNFALLEGRNKVEDLGYKPQVELSDNQANLFIFDGEDRVLLQRDGTGYTDKKKERTYTQQQLLDQVYTAPEQFSNNVMTRPLMQEYLFPVLGTVLGPAEVAYWGITKEAFHLLGMRMPLVIPRIEVTLMEGTVQKHMNKYALTVDDVLFHFEDKKQEWLHVQDTLGLEERFSQVKGQFREAYEPLIELVSGVNPGLKKLGATNLAKILEQIEFLQNKAQDAHQTQFDSALRQLERIHLSLLPLAKPQERVYNIFAYLNRYGDSWLKQLVDMSIPLDGMHRLYYL